MICVTTTIWTDDEAAEILGLHPVELQFAVQAGAVRKTAEISNSASGEMRFFNLSDLVEYRANCMLSEAPFCTVSFDELEEAMNALFDDIDLHRFDPLLEVLDDPETIAARLIDQLVHTVGDEPTEHPSGASRAVVLGSAAVAALREVLVDFDERVGCSNRELMHEEEGSAAPASH